MVLWTIEWPGFSFVAGMTTGHEFAEQLSDMCGWKWLKWSIS